jgi:hypothetical protein
MARGAGKTNTLIQELQLEVTDLNMDLEVAYKKIGKLEETVRQYEHIPF